MKNMKTSFLFLAALAIGAPAMAESPDYLATWSDGIVATWSEDSGSLPPEFAWKTDVMFEFDGWVTIRHCKGYAEEAPGCWTVVGRLSAQSMMDLDSVLAAALPDLVANPPQAVSDPPVGGGSTRGSIGTRDTVIHLPAYPIEADAARVADLLEALKDATPPSWLEGAIARAKPAE
jgi:hypothetical protein